MMFFFLRNEIFYYGFMVINFLWRVDRTRTMSDGSPHRVTILCSVFFWFLRTMHQWTTHNALDNGQWMAHSEEDDHYGDAPHDPGLSLWSMVRKWHIEHPRVHNRTGSLRLCPHSSMTGRLSLFFKDLFYFYFMYKSMEHDVCTRVRQGHQARIYNYS